MQQNKNQRPIFNKNFYRNINITTPVTMNNSRKSSVEKRIKKQIGTNLLNNNKKNSMINFGNNWTNNNSINHNLNYQIIKPNYSNERITYINRQNNSNLHNIFINKGKIINNKINHTTVNSPNRTQLSSIQIRLKNDNGPNMHKIFFRPGFSHNLNTNLNVKLPNNTTANSRDISNLSSANKSSDINHIINNNEAKYIISTNILNLKNNNFVYKSKNKQNKRCKTISKKQSYNDLIETDIKNQTENIEAIF